MRLQGFELRNLRKCFGCVVLVAIPLLMSFLGIQYAEDGVKGEKNSIQNS